jgi:hypothetical protein
LLGPAGLALDDRLRPVVASASRSLRQSTLLRLIRLGGRRVSSLHVTREGFPRSLDVPAAMPVLLPDRRLHVVEIFGVTHSVQGIEWGREGDAWWGQVLGIGIFERTVGPVRALVDARGTLWSAWTAVGLGKNLVVLASRRGAHEQSRLFEDASLAALALGPSGPEVAVNGRRGARILQAGRTGVTLDGTVADFAVDTKGRRNVLLSRGGSLFLVQPPLGRAIVPAGV